MSFRIALAAMIATSLSFSGGAQGAAAQAPAAAQAVLESHPYAGVASCRFDRIMLGPGGSEIAAWTDHRRYIYGTNMIPPNVVVTGRVHDPAQSDADRLFGYRAGGLRLFPIRWSPDGSRLFVRVWENDQRVVSIDADGGAARAEAALDPRWRQIGITSLSHGDVAMLRRPDVVARARKFDGTSLIRGAATLHRDVQLVAGRKADLDLVRVGPSGLTPVGIAGSHTRRITVFPHSRDYEEGIAYLGAPTRRDRDYIPYQQPLPDLRTGDLAGRFGLTRIALRAPGRLAGPLAQFHSRLNGQGRVILDASASGEAIAVLTLAANGDRALSRISAAGINERPLCAPISGSAMRAGMKPPYPLESADKGMPLRVAIAAVDREGREVTAPGNPILVRYSLADDGRRDLVLDFHGGPGGTIADKPFPDSLRLLTPTRDVVAVEYSGSLGGGAALTQGIARRGMAALERDVDAAIRWAARHGYRRVYVLGGSFGAVPALVAVKRHRRAIAGSFLVVPLLRLQDPAAWASRGSGLKPVGTDTQLAYEASFYGSSRGRRRFAESLEELVRTAPLGQNDHFYFGELDPMSVADHLPPGPSPRTVVPKMVHGAAGIEETIWKDILSHLD